MAIDGVRRGPDGERIRYQRIAHWLVRLLAVANLVHFGAMSYEPYFRVVVGGRFENATGSWMVASTVLLPAFVGFEGWWMRKDAQVRALLIDGALVLAWFVVYWSTVIDALWHHVNG